ncbi:MAG: Holliday junction branch migration protein RuvA [Candidatus Omnitrophica bacterium]|nr:Holliday junction branch migration protein RuvA [Candidatus Omnitrophota bacterium]MCM8800356.1 Holliday junction branch migration protein RuvA [Candidatus Omnitrophota bacterium]
MIASIEGKLLKKDNNSLLIEVKGITYRVYVTQTTMQRIDEFLNPDGTVKLITYHYLHVEPSRNIPILIGFLNEVEKEFFETFITVSGIGPKAALKALNQPISLIAYAISNADLEFLKSLPGIGAQRAKEIIAKLQDKVGKFGLVKDEVPVQKEVSKDIQEEAINILIQLQYKKQEALAMVRKAIERNPHLKTTEELLNEIYRQRIK